MNFASGGRARHRATVPAALIALGVLTYATLAFAAPSAQHTHDTSQQHHAVAAHSAKPHALTAR